METLCLKAVLSLCVLWMDFPSGTGHSGEKIASNHVIRFREKPPPFVVERAGTIGVYQCLPELSLSNDTEKTPLEVKVTWKTPNHVPHLNQSLHAWNEFKGHGYFINPDNNSLVLVDLEVSDSGVYTCVMQLGEEVVETTMQLHVLYIPPYEFAHRALIGLLATTLMAMSLGLLIGLKKLVVRFCWKTSYRHQSLELDEIQPSIQ